ncbi:hypothetical protein BGX31_003854, partial [Mortierella sp. GBA43]
MVLDQHKVLHALDAVHRSKNKNTEKTGKGLSSDPVSTAARWAENWTSFGMGSTQ